MKKSRKFKKKNDKQLFMWGTLSGKAGNIVFIDSKYGNFIRKYVIPSNPNTEGQQKVRSNWHKISCMWSNLTYKQAENWGKIAAMKGIMNKDKTGLLTGRQFFFHTNLNLMNAGCEPIQEYPMKVRSSFKNRDLRFEIVNVEGKEDLLVSYKPALEKHRVIIVKATKRLFDSEIPEPYEFKKILVIDSSWNQGNKRTSIIECYFNRLRQLIREGMLICFEWREMDCRNGEMSEAKHSFAIMNYELGMG